MTKQEELNQPTSCLNKARDEEMIFVLLGRDEAAPVAIRAWCEERIRLGKNSEEDIQIRQAYMCARYMELQAIAYREKS